MVVLVVFVMFCIDDNPLFEFLDQDYYYYYIIQLLVTHPCIRLKS